MANEPIRLNLGAGEFPLDGYQNLDIQTGVDARRLTMFGNNTVDEVRASHLLEHFTPPDADKALREWVRVLKPGGLLRISVPDFKALAQDYLGAHEYRTRDIVMGAHVTEHDYHRSLWDRLMLTTALAEVGIESMTDWQGDVDSSRYPLSLNIQGIKAATPLGPFDWLAAYASNVYSQAGEDGILTAILDKFPQDRLTRTCVEIGSADGVFMTNTRALVEQRGYRAAWLEKDADAATHAHRQLVKAGLDSRVEVCVGEVNVRSIADMLKNFPAPDVLRIDTDGQELNLWNALPPGIKPLVVVVEFDPNRQGALMPSVTETWQQGVDAVERFARAKGYEIVVAAGCNAICVRHDLVRCLYDPAFKEPNVTRGVGAECQACMTMPRLSFTDNMFCALGVFPKLGIPLIRSSGVFWDKCIEDLLTQTVDGGYKYAITIDYDSTYTAADVKGLYDLMEAHPEVDALASLQMRRSCQSPLFTLANEDGKALTTVDMAVFDEPLLRVNSAHFGLTILRCAAFEGISRPWFHHKPDEHGTWVGPQIVDGAFVGGSQDADIAFWAKWRAAGRTLYQANLISAGHLQLMVTWPGLDMKPVYQHVHDYNLDGKPTEGVR